MIVSYSSNEERKGKEQRERKSSGFGSRRRLIKTDVKSDENFTGVFFHRKSSFEKKKKKIAS